MGHQDGMEYLVMEFLEGETLADRLKKGPMSPEQVLKCGIEICEGLEKAVGSAPVGRILVAIQAEQEVSSPVTLVLTWDAEVKK